MPLMGNFIIGSMQNSDFCGSGSSPDSLARSRLIVIGEQLEKSLLRRDFEQPFLLLNWRIV